MEKELESTLKEFQTFKQTEKTDRQTIMPKTFNITRDECNCNPPVLLLSLLLNFLEPFQIFMESPLKQIREIDGQIHKQFQVHLKMNLVVLERARISYNFTLSISLIFNHLLFVFFCTTLVTVLILTLNICLIFIIVIMPQFQLDFVNTCLKRIKISSNLVNFISGYETEIGY